MLKPFVLSVTPDCKVTFTQAKSCERVIVEEMMTFVFVAGIYIGVVACAMPMQREIAKKNSIKFWDFIITP